MTLYGRDLSHAHDSGFGFIARSGAASLVERLRAAGADRGLVIDLGCGSGIAARILIDAGYAVHGVDQSADLVAIARERAPEATFDVASIHDAQLPAGAVAVTAMGEIVNFAGLDDRLFPRVRESLRPGGLFVFDVATPGRDSTDPRRTWHEGDGWVVCLEAQEDPDGRKLTRRITTFRRHDGSWARSDETHVLTLYDAADLVGRLSRAGFEDAHVDGEGYGPGVQIAGLPVIVARA